MKTDNCVKIYTRRNGRLIFSTHFNRWLFGIHLHFHFYYQTSAEIEFQLIVKRVRKHCCRKKKPMSICTTWCYSNRSLQFIDFCDVTATADDDDITQCLSTLFLVFPLLQSVHFSKVQYVVYFILNRNQLKINAQVGFEMRKVALENERLFHLKKKNKKFFSIN